MTRTQRQQQLLASLAVVENGSLYLGDPDAPRAYFDWATREGDGVMMEVGDSSTVAVQLSLGYDDLLALQQRLTAWLIANDPGGHE